jgi:hypothetical protein
MPLNEDAANFLKYAFAETKDLALHFLTVVTAVLVFSLTFAEKIVNFNSAGRSARLFISVSWCSLLLSIVSCGIAICYVALSGGAASANGDPRQYLPPMHNAILCLSIAGVLFVLALVTLIIAALTSALKKV